MLPGGVFKERKKLQSQFCHLPSPAPGQWVQLSVGVEAPAGPGASPLGRCRGPCWAQGPAPFLARQPGRQSSSPRQPSPRSRAHQQERGSWDSSSLGHRKGPRHFPELPLPGGETGGLSTHVPARGARSGVSIFSALGHRGAPQQPKGSHTAPLPRPASWCQRPPFLLLPWPGRSVSGDLPTAQATVMPATTPDPRSGLPCLKGDAEP